MKRAITLVLMLLMVLLPACALADVVTYTPDFYVADYAEVLSDELEGLIVLNNDRLDKACGAQIVVVTVNSTDGMEIENYAYTLFNQWKIGDKAKNNGLLILLAVQDGTYWTMPGKGLQDYLTAGDLDEMANEYFIPHAQQGNYGEGIHQLFAACFDKISIAYNSGVALDESLYYTWLQGGTAGSDGAKFLSEPLREAAPSVPSQPVNNQTTGSSAVPPMAPPAPKKEGGGIGILPIIIILIVVVILIRSRSTVRSRPGQRSHAAPHPGPRPAPHPGPRPAPRPAPRPVPGPAPRPAPRPPMGGRPTGGYNRPSGPVRPAGNGSRPMSGARTGGGGMTRGGGSGGSFNRPVSRPSAPRPSGGSRPSGGFGGGRSGGGGVTRGGGSGGSFRGGR